MAQNTLSLELRPNAAESPRSVTRRIRSLRFGQLRDVLGAAFAVFVGGALIGLGLSMGGADAFVGVTVGAGLSYLALTFVNDIAKANNKIKELKRKN